MPTDPPTPADAGPPPARVGPWPPLLAGLAAGLIAWAGGELTERIPTTVVASEYEIGGSQQLAGRAAGIGKKAVLTYGLLGGVLGLSLGAVGGLMGRSGKRAGLGAAVGLLAGGGLGAAASKVLVPLFIRNERVLQDDLLLPLLTHGGTWAAIGLAGGLAFGLGLGGPGSRLVHATLGGLLGGAVAAGVYEVAGAVLFPLEKTAQPISEGVGSRLFARLVVAGLVAVCAAIAA